MKILMVNKFLYPRGGAESYMLKLGKCLEDKGNFVEYFGMFDEKNTVGNSLGLYTGNVDFHSSSTKRFAYPFKIIYSFEAKNKIAKILDDFKPDVVHMNNINFQITPSIIREIKKRGIALVQTVHDYQMICPNHLLYDFNENAVCTRCIGGSKLNCIKHRCIHNSLAKSVIGAAEGLLYSHAKTYKDVDLYICPSRFLESKLLEASGIYSGKTFVLHNFIKKPEKAAFHNAENPYIVFAGRFSKEKGTDLLAKCAALVPEVRFIAAGSGPEEYALSAANIHLTGFLQASELEKLILGAKAVIVPSVCYENCSLTILESLAAGIPVITMNYGGMAELVSDGVNGVLIKNPTAQAAAEAVRKIMYDNELYGKIKQNCSDNAPKIITAENYCGILLEKYRELINKR